jgi:mono/diheme cytochrome c family protein
MGTRKTSRAIVVGYRTCAAITWVAALAACHGEDRGIARNDTSTTTSADQQAKGSMDSLTTPAHRPKSADSGQDSGRAGDIARAPRANPNAPPKPKLTPDDSGNGSDTNPKQPQTPQPEKSKGTTESSGELRDKYHSAPRDTVSAVVYTGWKYFNLNCARCHGEDVTGTTIAPHLIDSFKSGKVDHAEFWRVVHGSRAERGMPNWSGLIDDDKLQAIYEYVKGRSEGKIHPGRPAQQGG